MPIELRYPVNTLISYHYFQKSNIEQLSKDGLRVIADSGAFSADNIGAAIDLPSYALWIKRWRSEFTWVAGLDVIGNAAKTWTNWQFLRREGLDPVPTIHFGADPKELDKYAELGVDFCGLGGLVAHATNPDRMLRWCLQVFRYARDTHPEMRFHGWGVGHPKLLYQLPWYSVDSSGWSQPYRYGRLRLFDNGAFVQIKLDGREVFKHAALIRRYGVAPADIAVSKPSNRSDICRISARSFQHLEDYMRKKFTVEPPSYGVSKPRPVGPSVALAVSGQNEFYKAFADPNGPHVHLAENDYEHTLKALKGPNVHLAEGTVHILSELGESRG